jgi:hypothetical protein
MANQSHYQTMFGGFLTDWNRYPDLMQRAEATFQLLVDAVRDEQRERRLVAGDPVELAEVFRSFSHGISTLGAAQHLPRTSTGVEDLAVLGCRALRDGMRGSRQRLESPKR